MTRCISSTAKSSPMITTRYHWRAGRRRRGWHKFPESNAAFWSHVAIAKQLHNIKKVIVLDSRDCGAFKVAFAKDYKGAGAAETAQHKVVMQQVKDKLAKTHPDL